MIASIDPVAYVAVFGAGVVGFVSPCVLPLVPAYLAMVGGEVGAPRPRVIGGTLLFLAGFTAVVASLGAGAAAAGGLLDDPVRAGRVGGALTVLAGLALLAGRLRPTGALMRTRTLIGRLPQGRWWRPAVVGVAFGTAWTPCVGPLLGAALGPALGSGSPAAGALLLAAYAAGLGLPFLALSLGLGSVPGLLPRLRRFGPPAGLVAGVALVLLGVLVFTGRTELVVPGTVARTVS